MKAHFGDVEDMSQQVRGGLTLDMYARLSAELAQPGADFNAVLARHAVTPEVWNLGREAWNEAMSQDTMHKITTQYGHAVREVQPGPRGGDAGAGGADRGQPRLRRRRSRTSRRRSTRREGAGRGALGDAEDALAGGAHAGADDPDGAGGRPAAPAAGAGGVRAAIDRGDERHDKETVGGAEAAARDLVELKQFNDDAKGAISRALLRGQEHLATLRAAFAPIQNKNVPERIYLQSEIQDYTSLVETLRGDPRRVGRERPSAGRERRRSGSRSRPASGGGVGRGVGGRADGVLQEDRGAVPRVRIEVRSAHDRRRPVRSGEERAQHELDAGGDRATGPRRRSAGAGARRGRRVLGGAQLPRDRAARRGGARQVPEHARGHAVRAVQLPGADGRAGQRTRDRGRVPGGDVLRSPGRGGGGRS